LYFLQEKSILFQIPW